MNKKVRIEGLDCPNCARSLEGEINRLVDVKNAKIDFLKSTLVFESNEPEIALKNIVSLTKKLEPDAKIVDDSKVEKKSAKQKEHITKFVVNISLLLVGIAIGICVLCIPMPTWLFWSLYVVSILLMGYKTYYKAVQLLFKGVINENLLITISVVGASVIGEYMEALMVVGLYTIGKLLEGFAVDRSRSSIAKLTNMQPEYAVVLNGENEEKVSPSEVKIGSLILVKAGEKIPVDGKIVEGTLTEVNGRYTRSGTGEVL